MPTLDVCAGGCGITTRPARSQGCSTFCMLFDWPVCFVYRWECAGAGCGACSAGIHQRGKTRGHDPCDLIAHLQPQAQNTPAGYRRLRMRHSDNLPFKWGPEFSFLSSRATSHDSLRFWKRPSRSSTAGTDSWIQSPSPHSRGASPPLSSTPPLSSSSPTGLCCRTQKKLLWESFAGTWGTLGLSLSHPPTRCFSIFVLMLLVYFV